MFGNCEVLKQQAVSVVANDRRLYLPFLEHIILFAANNECYLAGEFAIKRLTAHEGLQSEGCCEVYCDNVFPTAQKLADQLLELDSPFLDKKTICLQTVIKHRECVLSINARHLARFYGLERLRGRRLPDVFMKRSPGNPYLPIEYFLAGVYRSLCIPCSADKWSDHIATESSLFHQWQRASQVTQVAQITVDEADYQKHVFHTLSKHAVIVDGLFTRHGAPFVIHDDADHLCRLLGKTLRNKTKIQRVFAVEAAVAMPSDTQLTVHTLYGEHHGSRFTLCNVYNLAYDLCPVIKNNHVRITHPLLTLRVAFCAMWIALCAEWPADYACAAKCALYTRQKTQDVTLLPPSEYIGHLVTDKEAKKKALADEQRLPDYLPFAKHRAT